MEGISLIKRYFIIIVCCLTALLALACSPEKEDTEDFPLETLEHTYTLTRLAALDTGYEWNITGINEVMNYYYGDKIHLFNLDTVTYTAYNLLYDTDGTLTATDIENDFYDRFRTENEAYIKGQDLFVCTQYALSDGRYLVESTVNHKPQLMYFFTDANGRILSASNPITHAGPKQSQTASSYLRNIRLLCVDDGCFVLYDMYGDSTFYVLDAALQVHGPFETPSPIRGGYRDADETVVLFCDNGSALRYEPDRDQAYYIELYFPSDAVNGAYDMFYGPETVYLVCNDGIYIQKNNTETLLLDWQTSYLDPEKVYILDILPNDAFLIWYDDPMLGEFYPAILSPHMQQVAAREHVVLASIYCTWEEFTFLRNGIYMFNRENETYQIDWIPYDVRMIEKSDFGRTMHMKTQDAVFEEDLLQGKAFDLLFFGSANDANSYISMLEEKQLLEDLSFFSDDIGLLDNIKSSYAAQGRISVLPVSVRLTGLLTTTKTPIQNDTFDYDVLQTFINDRGAEEAIFTADHTEALRAITQFDFIDFAQKQCSFTDEAYLSFLSLLDQLQTDNTLIAPQYGKIYTTYHTMYMNLEPFAALNEGKLKFVNFEIDNIHALPLYLYLAQRNDCEPVICGFPSKDGGTLYMRENLKAAIYKKGTNPAGADVFMRFLFSDEIQTCRPLTQTGVPVTKSAWEKCIEEGWYYLKESTEDVYTAGIGTHASLMLSIKTHTDSVLDEETLNRLDDVQTWYLSPQNRDALFNDFMTIRIRHRGDPLILSIIDEELQQTALGVRTREEAVKMIQSRVGIYLSE